MSEDDQVQQVDMPSIAEIEAQKSSEKAANSQKQKSGDVFDMTKLKTVEESASDFVLDSREQIIDALNRFDLPDGVASEIFREAVSLTKRLCPRKEKQCGAFTIVPSDRDYLQTGRVTKIGAIQIDLDKRRIEIPIEKK